MSKAFEPERIRRLPWHSDNWQDKERFYTDIESETVHARDRFKFPGAHLDDEKHSREYWLSVITEEVGKLSQTVNKLHICEDGLCIKSPHLRGLLEQLPVLYQKSKV